MSMSSITFREPGRIIATAKVTTIESEVKFDYSDVLLVPQRSVINSRSEIVLTNSRGVVPIIAANMDHVGTFEMARSFSKYKILTALVKHYSLSDLIHFYRDEPEVAKYCLYSLGATGDDLGKLRGFTRSLSKDSDHNHPYMYCIDVANGYMDRLVNFVSMVKAIIPPGSRIMVGNLVTVEPLSSLVMAGASVFKIGIGPGSVCTTRSETGVGYPQFSAVAECSNYFSTCADGGITCPGDVAKAFAAGAAYVMIGGEFAAHEEGYSHYEKVADSSVPFYGSASEIAQERHGTGAEYRSSEGVSISLKLRGSIENTIKRYLNGLRSACSYIGAPSISTMKEHAQFIRVNHQMDRRYK